MAFIDAVVALGQMFLASKVGAGALTGLAYAAYADVQTFRTWQTWNDARAFRWDVAVFKWVQGFVGGALVGLGIDQFAGGQ